MRTNIFPITFSVPECKVINEYPHKTKILSNLIPGNTSTYIYPTEELYYKEYQTSMFAMTTKKVGWDCMRHYEIIMNGALPYFPDIGGCPGGTMYFFPKHLTHLSNKLYERAKIYNSVDSVPEDLRNEIKSLTLEMLQFLKNNLTTTKIAEYILDCIPNKNVKSILFLSGDPGPDYLNNVTLHGLKSIFGINCHDHPKVSHIYKIPEYDYKSLYGKGMTYTNLLGLEFHYESLSYTIEEDIKAHKYDIVIYGNYHRGTPYFDLVKQYYSKEDIILMCGEDALLFGKYVHGCCYNQYSLEGHIVFMRELV